MNRQPFFAPLTRGGTSFEEMAASIASCVPLSGARPENLGEPFTWQSACVASETVSLWRACASSGWTMRPESEETRLYIMFPLVGGMEILTGGKLIAASAHTAVLAVTPELGQRRVRYHGAHDRVGMKFDDATASRVLASVVEGAALQNLGLQAVVDLSSDVGRMLSLLAQTFTAGMFGERLLERSPKAMALLTESLLRHVFEHVPHRYSHRIGLGHKDAGPWYVGRAEDFMHANMQRCLTISEIADAVGVSARALQYGFRHARGLTPNAYLSRIRLDAVHSELSHPQNTLSVGDIALKWGFLHMGRFSQLYRQAFGTYPSQTLREARRLNAADEPWARDKSHTIAATAVHSSGNIELGGKSRRE